jgi:hypothetical protein
MERFAVVVLANERGDVEPAERLLFGQLGRRGEEEPISGRATHVVAVVAAIGHVGGRRRRR